MLQPTTLVHWIFKPRLFSLNAMRLYTTLSAFSSLFIVLHKQYDERSSCKMFVFSLSREFYRDLIVVFVFCSHCLFHLVVFIIVFVFCLHCLLHLVAYILCWFTVVGLRTTSSMFVYVSVPFVYRF